MGHQEHRRSDDDRPVPEQELPEASQEWAGAAQWLGAAIDALPVAGVIDIGPRQARVGGDTYDVPCAQIQRLTGHRWLLRLSTVLMIIPLLDSYAAGHVRQDCWHYDDLFDDCTHGYLVSRSTTLVAEAAMSWFADREGFAAPDELGYCTTTPKRLPRGRGLP